MIARPKSLPIKSEKVSNSQESPTSDKVLLMIIQNLLTILINKRRNCGFTRFWYGYHKMEGCLTQCNDLFFVTYDTHILI